MVLELIEFDRETSAGGQDLAQRAAVFARQPEQVGQSLFDLIEPCRVAALGLGVLAQVSSQLARHGEGALESFDDGSEAIVLAAGLAERPTHPPESLHHGTFVRVELRFGFGGRGLERSGVAEALSLPFQCFELAVARPQRVDLAELKAQKVLAVPPLHGVRVEVLQPVAGRHQRRVGVAVGGQPNRVRGVAAGGERVDVGEVLASSQQRHLAMLATQVDQGARHLCQQPHRRQATVDVHPVSA